MNLSHDSETLQSHEVPFGPTIPKDRLVDMRLWQIGSVAWWMASLFAWAFVAAHAAPGICTDGSSLTTLGLTVVIISVALRWPLLHPTLPVAILVEHVIWLLAITACLNWIGFLFLIAARSAEVMPTVMLWIVGEAWLVSRISNSDRLAWLKACWKPVPEQLGRVFSASSSSTKASINQVTTKQLPATPTPPRELASDTELKTGFDSDSGELRRSVEGINEDGERYMTGEIRIDFAPGQASETVVIGFCPALRGAPSIEAETADIADVDEHSGGFDDGDFDEDSLAIRVIHCTPAGARIIVRRSTSQDRRVVNLTWYAVENLSNVDTAAGTPAATNLTRPLP